MSAEKFELNQNLTLIAPMHRVIGGRTTEREIISDEMTGESRETEAKVKTTIEDVDERKRAERIVHNANGLLRRKATNTPFGWLAPRELIAEIEHKLEDLKWDATNFNQESQTCQVKLKMLTIDVSQAMVDPGVARAIAEHVIDELSDLKKALRAGESSRAQSILNFRVGAIHDLTVGIVRDTILCAVDEARGALKALKDKIKGDGAIAETPASAGRSLDLTMLDSALGMLGAKVEDAPADSSSGGESVQLVA